MFCSSSLFLLSTRTLPEPNRPKGSQPRTAQNVAASTHGHQERLGTRLGDLPDIDHELVLRKTITRILNRDGRVGLVEDRPPRQPPPPAPSGNPLWGSRAPPWTDIMLTSITVQGSEVRGGVGRSALKGGDSRRSSPQGNYSVGSVTHHRTELAAPADFLAICTKGTMSSMFCWRSSSTVVDVPVLTQRRVFQFLDKVFGMPVVSNDRCLGLTVQKTVESTVALLTVWSMSLLCRSSFGSLAGGASDSVHRQSW